MAMLAVRMGIRAEALETSVEIRSSPRYHAGITSPPAGRIVLIHPRAGVFYYARHRVELASPQRNVGGADGDSGEI